ncbi:hypothetical protein COM34_14660 [Bacillus wiedmannii]|uniref:hypothetical protein n=1 Tax=Bacillus wiedmannii TaxID=1890302 RepID=UPI000BF39814|nr:hypothetical protein [Bacillus wiedmannii]PGD07598.1 hypothetical protein COM34_14660 [Bacillus wiedmannii]
MEGKLVLALVEEQINENEPSLNYTELDLNKFEPLTDEAEELLITNDFIVESEKMVRNLREKTAVIIDLLEPGFQTYYNYSPRPKFEVFGGYKIAKNRQASLAANFDKVKVYNLYFRFTSNSLSNLKTSAMMYTNEKEEVILLSPQNTDYQIEQESLFYKSASANMIFHGMNPDNQSILLENLRLLTRNERCAQSLQHEFGHILHWRLFKFLNLNAPHEIYEWFLENGYARLLSLRSPEFTQTSEPSEKLYLLKESLVEDYRIWLNFKDNNGMFILPNVNTYFGDFLEPSLLQEGVGLMKEMLKGAINNSLQIDDTKKFSGEPDRVLRGKEIYNKALSTNWKPGSDVMSEQDHLDVIKKLKEANFQIV